MPNSSNIMTEIRFGSVEQVSFWWVGSAKYCKAAKRLSTEILAIEHINNVFILLNLYPIFCSPVGRPKGSLGIRSANLHYSIGGCKWLTLNGRYWGVWLWIDIVLITVLMIT